MKDENDEKRNEKKNLSAVTIETKKLKRHF